MQHWWEQNETGFLMLMPMFAKVVEIGKEPKPECYGEETYLRKSNVTRLITPKYFALQENDQDLSWWWFVVD